MQDGMDKIAPGSPRNPASKLELRISTGGRNLGVAHFKKTTWTRLCEKMSHTVRDNITMAQYAALSQKDRHDRKNHGWFVGGFFKDNKRKLANIEQRSVLSFDLDELGLELYAELVRPKAGYLAAFEHFVYTTRSHTKKKPRLRVVVPLSREITAHEFGPVIRIVASRINPWMDQIDPVSYRITQLMFWPNTSQDGEFVHNWHRGALLDPDEVLAGFGDDWNDYSKLPRSPREAAKIHEPGTQVQDPRNKRGIIGAWCRAHSISDVIENHWGDRYAPGDATDEGTERYSYLPGTTTNGVLVYDDLLAWSHHSSDPIAIGRAVNAWDFERINRFGELDTKGDVEDFDNDPRRLPSFKAMEDFAAEDRETMIEMQKANYDLNAMADDLALETEDEDEDDESPPGSEVTKVSKEAKQEVSKAAKAEVQSSGEDTQQTGDAADWMSEELDLNRDGLVKSTIHNIVVLLENDPRFKGAFAHNQFTNSTSVVRRVRSRTMRRDTGPIRDRQNGDPLIDTHVEIVRSIIEAPRGEGRHGWGLKVANNNMVGAVDIVARNNSFHPVQSYLRACVWDGVPRIKSMLSRYWNVADSTYHQEVAYNFMVAGVARVMEPGHKFDFMPIFEGEQGRQKSTAIQTLFTPAWFGELEIGAGGKERRDLVEMIVGKWGVEMPELAVMMDDRHTVEKLKALFSTQRDRTRMAYRRNAEDFPRQCLFFGTTNSRAYLRDETGNRRFWPIVIPPRNIDVEGLARDRDLLWAEAHEEYKWMRKQGRLRDKAVPLPLYLQGQAQAQAMLLQGQKMQATEVGMWRGLALEWLDTPVAASRSRPGWRNTDDDDDAPVDEPMVLRMRVTIRDLQRHVLHDENKNRNTSVAIGKMLHSLPGWEVMPVVQRAGKDGPQMTWQRIVADDDPSDL